MSTELYVIEQTVNSRGNYAANYYKYKFEVLLDSQDDDNNTSTITMNAYLGVNATNSNVRWSSSYYYMGFTEVLEGVTTRLSWNRHASFTNQAGERYTYSLVETYTKTYTHDEDGNLDLELHFIGQRTSGSSTYVPVNVDFGSGALPVPEIAQARVRIKVNGSWQNAQVYIKVNGAWTKAKKVLIKDSGTWYQSK